MNLYLISQKQNTGYDTYDSAVVAAQSEDAARRIHPSPYVTHFANNKWMGTYKSGSSEGGEYVAANFDWVSFEDRQLVDVKFLGKTDLKTGVVLASFNAG